MSDHSKSRSLVVFDDGSGKPGREMRDLELGILPAGYVRVRTKYSSLNYKDALCATGNPGVARSLPLVPGIDAAGTVVESQSDNVATGSEVLVFHADFGTKVNGGYGQFIDVPAEFVYSLPPGMSDRQAMVLGTAGFTAAQSVNELIKHGIEPGNGPVVVSGATGGVGTVAVRLLSKLGYEVVASSGKADRFEMLKRLGASDVLDRSALNDASKTPLLKGRWNGAIDTVGGNTLATILRATKTHGCVTACGQVGGPDFAVTVFPFILRGVTLQGIDSANIGREERSLLWRKMATDWKLDDLEELVTEVSLDGLDEQINAILGGEIAGRVIVKINSD